MANIHFRLCLAQFFLERKTFRVNVVEKLETHIFCSVFLFFENRAISENVEKKL
jgi:hypothetical protein